MLANCSIARVWLSIFMVSLCDDESNNDYYCTHSSGLLVVIGNSSVKLALSTRNVHTE